MNLKFLLLPSSKSVDEASASGSSTKSFPWNVR